MKQSTWRTAHASRARFTIRTKASAVCAVAALLAFSAAAAHAAAGDVASLYGPQPPADASYLRVFNAASQPARVALSGSAAPATVAPGAVSSYSVLAPGVAARVTIDGQALADIAGAAGAGSAASGAAVTLALRHDAQGWHATRSVGRYARADGLKATLHAFNFAPGCNAKIGVGGGPTVFAQIAGGAQDTRAVNPVSATLVGQCGAAASAPLALPALSAGDSYSLFVTGDAAKPVLSGARDALAWPPAAN